MSPCILMGSGREKIIRSIDVVVFEDQNIEDTHNKVKLVISRGYSIYLNPIPLLENYKG